MAPDAVVIANGHVLGERDDYIDGAAKADAGARAEPPPASSGPLRRADGSGDKTVIGVGSG